MQQSCFHIHSDEKVLLELQWQGRPQPPYSTAEQFRLQITWTLELRDWQSHNKDFKSRIAGFPVETLPSAKWKGLCEMILVAQLSWKLVVQKILCALKRKSHPSDLKKMSQYNCRYSVHFNENCHKFLHSSLLIRGFCSMFFDNTERFYHESQTVWLRSSRITGNEEMSLGKNILEKGNM